MSLDQKKYLFEIFKRYEQAFSKISGRINTYVHSLKLRVDKPFINKRYPIPMKYSDQVELEIKRRLDLGVIRKSKSNFINPVVIVIKKDGSVRICLDARELSKVIENDFEAPKRIEEI